MAVVREQLKKKAVIAPFKAVDAIEAAASLPFAEGLKREAELFRECLFSDHSKALIHVFFAEREVAKVGLPKVTPKFPVRRAAVIVQAEAERPARGRLPAGSSSHNPGNRCKPEELRVRIAGRSR